MKKMWTLIVALLAVGAVPSIPAAQNSPGKTIEVHVEPQPWQVRRAEFFKIVSAIQTSKGADRQAMAKLDAFLTNLEKNPVSITPMEAMDVWGVFYVPREGATQMKMIMTVISTYATLGWYDALRYASASGRAEILHNERFFLRPFVLASPQGIKYLKDFIVHHPKEAEEAVAVGIRNARKARQGIRLDEDWPTAYGLERMQCGLEGKKDCSKPPAMPKEKWDTAFEEAVAGVQRYYRDNSKK